MKRLLKPIVRPLREMWQLACGKDLRVSPELPLPVEHYGTEYGGWALYMPEKEKGDGLTVLSFGVGDDISFDLAIIERFGARVHAFDPTPRSIEWVAAQSLPENFSMHDYGIAAHDGAASFNPPENPEHISHTLLDRPETADNAIEVPVKRLATIVKELGVHHIDVLKMDIEGAEYEVIADLEESSIRPDQILVEFHHRFPGVGARKTRKAIETLQSMGYALYYVSGDNLDFCFIDRRLVEAAA